MGSNFTEEEWEDVADLCEQGAVACEIGYEEHKFRSRKRAAKWMKGLSMRAHMNSVAAKARKDLGGTK